MTNEDDVFLKHYNKGKVASAQCSEDDFEKIMEIFEETADLQAPFAAVDNTVVPYEIMERSLKYNVSKLFGRDIYEHWKQRKESSTALQPALRFETLQDSDDGDPYICFRRREVRQTRKTRARDQQSTDKLRRLRKELEEGRELIVMATHRELIKTETLAMDRAIFDQRAKVKEAKIRLGIRADDEDLINQKVLFPNEMTELLLTAIAAEEKTNRDSTAAAAARQPSPPIHSGRWTSHRGRSCATRRCQNSNIRAYRSRDRQEAPAARKRQSKSCRCDSETIVTRTCARCGDKLQTCNGSVPVDTTIVPIR